jgi:hypothetical protein
MSQSLKFGFLVGLLAGTTAVGTIGLMMGQAEANARPRAIQKPLKLELTQSPDGKTAYLWGIDPKTQALTFLRSARADGESAGHGLHESDEPGKRHLDPGDPEHSGHGQSHTPGDHDE